MRALAIGVLLLALIVPAAGAAGPKVTLPDVEDELMCVQCGSALNVSQAPSADQERQLIREFISEGLSKEQIKDRMVSEYGPKVLGEPRQWEAWLVPGLLAVLALAAVVLTARRWRRAGDASEPDSPPGAKLDADDARRLERDMAGYDL